MSSAITEGALEFIFSENISSTKYDDWCHYRNQFKDRCYKDNKAVDFIAYDENTAWLCEIKDFRLGDRNPEKIPLCDEIAMKIRDTLAGLVSANLQANVFEEKKFARKVLKCENINIVLHVEQPQGSSYYYDLADLKDKLCNLLKAVDPHVKVMSKKSAHPDIPWKVQ
ncbi:cysteinyl-tRNA synthetase [Rodentibacter ratti]|uniref:Cysteinyl-tRNA synthetase n=1 Tax=Rodentibacter ratti TaxID=1906745 RepID=A0A1V3L171_9PAST|nr:cysteinyl-tRNA synthetase [Rodentibacter ratti]OOF83714.1 cysteinyl-tRNA synthetase [Rodentibacter ratti]